MWIPQGFELTTHCHQSNHETRVYIYFLFPQHLFIYYAEGDKLKLKKLEKII